MTRMNTNKQTRIDVRSCLRCTTLCAECLHLDTTTPPTPPSQLDIEICTSPRLPSLILQCPILIHHPPHLSIRGYMAHFGLACQCNSLRTLKYIAPRSIKSIHQQAPLSIGRCQSLSRSLLLLTLVAIMPRHLPPQQQTRTQPKFTHIRAKHKPDKGTDNTGPYLLYRTQLHTCTQGPPY